MNSPVDIANQALIILGEKQIVSFDDGTTAANIMSVMYEPVKRNVLRMHEWGCATRVSRLALLQDAPVDPYWHFAYAKPDETIRIIDVFSDGICRYNRREWQVEEDVIVSRIGNAIARYTYDIPEPKLDAHVEALLVARLALDTAYSITASNTREGNLTALYKEKLMEARTTDNLEGSHEYLRTDTLQNARY
jgi:hypothetical protein